jgi:uncharacterized protein YecT (DUF1311 family)
VDAGDQKCLFKLVADPCINSPSGDTDAGMADCFRIQGAIWHTLLNDNCKTLLDDLDTEQTARARAMQVAYRDTTCRFYDDKIRGTMSDMKHAACNAPETARRAMLLSFFSGL